MYAVAEKIISPEDYLKCERVSPTKHEYFAGRIFAMAGASLAHNTIVMNVGSALNGRLRGGPCQPLANDMRVKISSTGLYTYPDLVVFCGSPIFDDSKMDTLTNPVVLVEVLSDSTEKYDRGDKFAHYQRIETLQEYVLISQHRQRIEIYRRQADNTWQYSLHEDPEGAVRLNALACELRLADVYEKVTFLAQEDDQSESSPETQEKENGENSC